jgi:hypothetical protein
MTTMLKGVGWAVMGAAIGLTGCAETSEEQPTRQEIQYASNLDAYVAAHPNRPQNILRAIEAKQIVRDMTLDEVRLVMEAQSMEGSHVERLWCDANSAQVAQCPADCASCRGVIVSRWGAIIHVKGKGSNPVVVDIRMTQSNRPNLGYFLATDPYLTYELARAIQAQQVVMGMTLDQVRQALAGYPLDERYFCGGKPAETCGPECARCAMTFEVQGTSVTLDNNADHSVMRVTRVAPLVQ